MREAPRWVSIYAHLTTRRQREKLAEFLK